MERGKKKKGIYVYIYLIHFAGQQKLNTTLESNYTPIILWKGNILKQTAFTHRSETFITSGLCNCIIHRGAFCFCPVLPHAVHLTELSTLDIALPPECFFLCALDPNSSPNYNIILNSCMYLSAPSFQGFISNPNSHMTLF